MVRNNVLYMSTKDLIDSYVKNYISNFYVKNLNFFLERHIYIFIYSIYKRRLIIL